MELPNFRESVEIEFWSLRNGVGCGGGVILDIDTLVRRICYRVKSGDSWRWQIKGFNRLPQSDWYAETDQESLNELGDNLDFEYV